MYLLIHIQFKHPHISIRHWNCYYFSYYVHNLNFLIVVYINYLSYLNIRFIYLLASRTVFALFYLLVLPLGRPRLISIPAARLASIACSLA